ncbi:hypothetical protein SAMN06265365_101480 [Tistlia consotensis]|uniref:DUF1328 domain-containing protein n=1 Tax=Tistlia consotensis USBA 355 TaxID=560819 RepID=A0A1Y6B4V5_9PROT|nr:hypothetical protein [Tistlia consotensis]SME92190.1 hypothetical protein SAMN05428998_101478 [Tistlia consotensis USBA 355]SNR27895.1 hypothetical protein SAMN06265365_101480 [Tistlia consotensis]
MDVVARYIIGALIGLIGLLGLFMASRAESGDGIYAAGLFLFIFAVLYIFFLIKRGFDHADRARHGRPH